MTPTTPSSGPHGGSGAPALPARSCAQATLPIALASGPDAFVVEEIPAYAPSGSGEHLFLRIEKRGITTDQLARAVARACGRPLHDVGFAGRKDRHAVARQWISARGVPDTEVAKIESALAPGARVLAASRHRGKLRLGHLIGNRFQLCLAPSSGEVATGVVALGERVAHVARHGLVNRFDTQRFGVGGATLRLARAWGRRDAVGAVRAIIDPTGSWEPGDALPEAAERAPRGSPQWSVVRGWRERPGDAAFALRSVGPQLRRLAASAAQAAVFDAVLAGREAAGLLHVVRPGDLARRLRGRPFRCTDENCAALCAEALPGVLEVFATGPLPGSDRFLPDEAVLEAERAWSASCEIDWSWLDRGGPLESPGDRRPLVVPLLDAPSVAPLARAPRTEAAALHEPEGIQLEIALPAGAYATQLLRAVGVEVPADRAEADASATLAQ